MNKEDLYKTVDVLKLRSEYKSLEDLNKELIEDLYNNKNLDLGNFCHIWGLKDRKIVRDKFEHLGISLRKFGQPVKKSFSNLNNSSTIDLKAEPEPEEEWIHEGQKITSHIRFRMKEERKDLKLRATQLMVSKSVDVRSKKIQVIDVYSHTIKVWLTLDDLEFVDKNENIFQLEELQSLKDEEKEGVF